jgi:hypothetical protein
VEAAIRAVAPWLTVSQRPVEPYSSMVPGPSRELVAVTAETRDIPEGVAQVLPVFVTHLLPPGTPAVQEHGGGGAGRGPAIGTWRTSQTSLLESPSWRWLSSSLNGKAGAIRGSGPSYGSKSLDLLKRPTS